MIPQFVAAKIVHAPVIGILVGVWDENYQIADWRIEENATAAKIAAEELSKEYGVPIHENTYRLLDI